MVPEDIQAEVYDTVGQRGESVDATWAPWWRAQAEAVAAVLRKLPLTAEQVDGLLAKEMAFADKLEAK